MPSRVITLLVTLFAAIMLAGSAHAQSSDMSARLGGTKSHALLIGISKYDHQRQLDWVDEEMRRISSALTNAGFSTYIPDQISPGAGSNGYLTKQQLKATIRAFAEKYGRDPENRLIIYFASHGYATSSADQRGGGYLITSEIGDKPEADAYSVKDLRDDLQALQTRHLFVFVNACFGAAMSPVLNTRSAEAMQNREAGFDAQTAYIRGKLDQPAWMFLSAGTDRQTVPDDKSPFALAVANGIDGEADLDGDGYIEGMELATYVRRKVPEQTSQLGAKNDPILAWLDSSKAGGDFVFKSRLGPRSESKATIVSQEDEATRARNARLLERRSFTECVDCPIMNVVDIGDRGPQPKIGIARTEITYLEWDACYRDLGCTRYIDDGGLGRGTRAVGGITWMDAQQYINWLDGKRRTVPSKDGTEQPSQCERYRLPTKSEWAAAANPDAKQTRFTWGDDVKADQASCWGCGEGQEGRSAMEVGSFLANDNGLFDMTGNLWEWVQDNSKQCDSAQLALPGGICTPGTVMGGSFATSLSGLSTLQQASVPRTRSPSVVGAPDVYALETVGLRVACTLKNP